MFLQLCKRRKSDTLEEAVNTSLALLAKEDGAKQRRQRKPSHFRLLKVDSERLTHTPYRSRHGSTKTKGTYSMLKLDNSMKCLKLKTIY